MKNAITFAIVSALAVVHGQENPGPSPTNSYGCEPHGDHWHCAGPLTASATLATTSATSSLVIITTASRTASDDHEDGKNGASSTTASLAPSPTESVGCEPHGDHWHCDGPAISTTESRSRNSTLSPSPTESIGCEPHGDHWHCDGPAITTTTQAPPAPTSGAISHTSGYNSLAGLVVLIVSFFL